jgi:D-amino-acid dehydrogenase
MAQDGDGNYLVPWPDGRIVAGATHESTTGFDARTTTEGVASVLDNALTLAPGLADATLDEVRVGLRPQPPDGKPLLGSISGVDGAFVGTGHGATGLQLGPYSGRVLADIVRDRTPPSNVDAFDPSRFA